MNAASLIFLLMFGTVLQALPPLFGWWGSSMLPVLPAIVVYFALYRTTGLMLTAALLAGLFQDSLSLMPIGYSSFCFAAAAFIIQKYRGVIVTQSALTHMVVTAAVQGGVTLFLVVMLLKDGFIPWRPGWLLLKIPSAMLMGLIVGPLVIAAVRALEEKLGLIEGNGDTYGAQHSFYGLG